MAESALIEKLRAALDRAEEIARAAAESLAHTRGHYHDVNGMCEDEYAHIEANDPALVLRTVAAHRRILDLYTASVERDEMMRDFMGSAPLATATAAYRETVEALAAVYFPEAPDADIDL